MYRLLQTTQNSNIQSIDSANTVEEDAHPNFSFYHIVYPVAEVLPGERLAITYTHRRERRVNISSTGAYRGGI